MKRVVFAACVLVVLRADESFAQPTCTSYIRDGINIEQCSYNTGTGSTSSNTTSVGSSSSTTTVTQTTTGGSGGGTIGCKDRSQRSSDLDDLPLTARSIGAFRTAMKLPSRNSPFHPVDECGAAATGAAAMRLRRIANSANRRFASRRVAASAVSGLAASLPSSRCRAAALASAFARIASPAPAAWPLRCCWGELRRSTLFGSWSRFGEPRGSSGLRRYLP